MNSGPESYPKLTEESHKAREELHAQRSASHSTFSADSASSSSETNKGRNFKSLTCPKLQCLKLGTDTGLGASATILLLEKISPLVWAYVFLSEHSSKSGLGSHMPRLLCRRRSVPEVRMNQLSTRLANWCNCATRPTQLQERADSRKVNHLKLKRMYKNFSEEKLDSLYFLRPSVYGKAHVPKSIFPTSYLPIYSAGAGELSQNAPRSHFSQEILLLFLPSVTQQPDSFPD